MNTTTILNHFFQYYSNYHHQRIPNSSIVSTDQVLFTTSGMHPLVEFFEEKPHPYGGRLVNQQRCLRTTDIEEVGDFSHLTSFSMLGTWSLGDYSHEQSLRWGWEFLTEVLGISPQRIMVTVWGGDDRVGPDTRSESIWNEYLPSSRIHRLSDNWWSMGLGPSGPDSEIFVWTGLEEPSSDPVHPGWVEVWNHVSMQYREPDMGRLPRSNVDTGLGLERLSMVMQGVSSVFDTDLFEPLRQSCQKVEEPHRRMVMDHLRSIVVCINDGVIPSNLRHGYVLRRLIRRVCPVVDSLVDLLPRENIEWISKSFEQQPNPSIHSILQEEEIRYWRMIERGTKLVQSLLRRGPLNDSDIRWLYETHGIPEEVTRTIIE